MKSYKKYLLSIGCAIFVVVVSDVSKTDTYFKLMTMGLLFYIFLFKKEDL